MRIALGSVEVTDRERVALALEQGRDGKASRVDCRDYLRQHGAASLDRLAFSDDDERNAEINRRMQRSRQA